MDKKRIFRIGMLLAMILLMLGADQASKYMVRQRVAPDQQITVIKNVVLLTRVENTGAFLSMGDNIPRPVYKVIMILVPLAVLIFLIGYLIKTTAISGLSFAGMCLIAGGGLGNIIDRILYGSVTDFLFFNFGLFHTGIVNVADIILTAGFFVLIIEAIFFRKKENPT
jgi:signal peptidase II